VSARVTLSPITPSASGGFFPAAAMQSLSFSCRLAARGDTPYLRVLSTIAKLYAKDPGQGGQAASVAVHESM
jgi:hypothetical protein